MFFDRKMKYGTVIYVCRVQEVVDYVKELVSSLRKWMLRVAVLLFLHAQNVLKAVSLTIHDIEGREIESFVIIQSENTLRVTDAIDFDRVSLKALFHSSSRNRFGARFCCFRLHPFVHPYQVQSPLRVHCRQCPVLGQHRYQQGNGAQINGRMGICRRCKSGGGFVL